MRYFIDAKSIVDSGYSFVLELSKFTLIASFDLVSQIQIELTFALFKVDNRSQLSFPPKKMNDGSSTLLNAYTSHT